MLNPNRISLRKSKETTQRKLSINYNSNDRERINSLLFFLNKRNSSDFTDPLFLLDSNIIRRRLKEKENVEKFYSVDNRFDFSSNFQRNELKINRTKFFLSKQLKKHLEVPNMQQKRNIKTNDNILVEEDCMVIKRNREDVKNIIKKLSLKKNEQIIFQIKCQKKDFPIKIKIIPLNSVFNLSFSFNNDDFIEKAFYNLIIIEPGDYKIKNNIEYFNIRMVAREKRIYTILINFFEKEILNLIPKIEIKSICDNNQNTYFFNFFHNKGFLIRKKYL